MIAEIIFAIIAGISTTSLVFLGVLELKKLKSIAEEAQKVTEICDKATRRLQADKMSCVHPICQRRKPVSCEIEEHLINIGICAYERARQEEKRQKAINEAVEEVTNNG